MTVATPDTPLPAPAEGTGATYEAQASAGLTHLGLSVAGDQLDAAAQRAAAEGWSYSHFLGYLLDAELRHRHDKRVQLNLQFAKFPVLKRLDAFDYRAQPSVDHRIIDELANGRFLSEGRNVVLLGPPGVGKTHLAIGLGVMTCERGHRVFFTTAMDLAQRLTRAVDSNRLKRAINALMQPKLLIIDEVGYLQCDPVQASLLFQVICQRYQRGQPICLTSNKAFSEWAYVFGDDAVMASAALDRLLHKSTVINIVGESYRLREKKQAGTIAANLVTPSQRGPAAGGAQRP
ncbi:MAG: IS21-like element helper ATPase IstB [Planctomycetota bacterium]|jgi:DNA replication protein DnaC|nr:IS21-like element helper ATPase IstB [Planctomycetota bacterium]